MINLVEDMVDDAVEFLQTNLQGKKVFVGFSGGKDSVVTARLVEMADLDHMLCYTNTGIEPPAVVKFVREKYPHCRIVRPKESFWKMIPKRNPPLFHAKWCCTSLKKEPSRKIDIKDRVMGIRAEESLRRKDYSRIEYFKRQDYTYYYPILDWKEWQVWEFIKMQNLEVPPLYHKFDRLGCVVCPCRRTKIHDMWKEEHPGYYKAFESAVRKWWDKRIGQGRTMAYDTVEEFLEDWYKGKAKWYGKQKGKGGKGE